MNQPISEKEFRFLVEVRRAAGAPYRHWNYVVIDPSVDAWVEYFASGLDEHTQYDFNMYMHSNYADLVKDGAVIPDHPEDYYGQNK